MKMLKLDSHQQGCQEKLQRCYLGPYTLVNQCANGNFRLCEKYLHFLKKSIHPSKLVKFYEDKLYKVNTQGHLESESMLPSESQNDMSTCSDASVDCDNEGM